MQLIDCILHGLICGAAAFLWCRVLTAPGMAAAFVPRLYWRIMGQHRTWKEQLAKPLFDCPVCNSFWIVLIFPCQGGPGLVGMVAALFAAYALDKWNGQ